MSKRSLLGSPSTWLQGSLGGRRSDWNRLSLGGLRFWTSEGGKSSESTEKKVPVSPMVAEMMKQYSLEREARMGRGNGGSGRSADGETRKGSEWMKFLRFVLSLAVTVAPASYVAYYIIFPVPEEQNYWVRFERYYREGRLHELESEERKEFEDQLDTARQKSNPSP